MSSLYVSLTLSLSLSLTWLLTVGSFSIALCDLTRAFTLNRQLL
jgi:hypothetical protein